jgi:pyruvate/2-oxoglutarate dehydrogenase complex dihydrolipoamide dehydrogenase (E3) component
MGTCARAIASGPSATAQVPAPSPTSTRGWIHGPGNEGFIKLVEDASRGVLVGATVMGPSGGEVMAMLALAIQAEVPVSALRTMIYAYPTFHRGVEGALASLSEARALIPAAAS